MKTTTGRVKFWEKHQKAVPTVDDSDGKVWGCFRSCFLQSAAPYTEGIAYKIRVST